MHSNYAYTSVRASANCPHSAHWKTCNWPWLSHLQNHNCKNSQQCWTWIFGILAKPVLPKLAKIHAFSTCKTLWNKNLLNPNSKMLGKGVLLPSTPRCCCSCRCGCGHLGQFDQLRQKPREKRTFYHQFLWSEVEFHILTLDQRPYILLAYKIGAWSSLSHSVVSKG